MSKKRTRIETGGSNIERRIFAGPVELRQEGDGPGTLIGHPVVYGARSVDMGGWFEEVVAGAFAASLRDEDQVALWSHEMSDVLGRTSAETLTLKDSKESIESRIILPDTQPGRDAAVLVKRGDVSGMSFGFFTQRAQWRILEETEDDRTYLRSILKGRLVEVSPVAFPAYPDTDVALRSLRQYRNDVQANQERRERRLRRLAAEQDIFKRRT